MRRVLKVSILGAFALGLVFAPAHAVAQPPAIPSLMPLKKPKKAKRKPRKPKKPKAPKVQKTTVTLEEGAAHSQPLPDFAKTQRFKLKGPSVLQIEVAAQSGTKGAQLIVVPKGKTPVLKATLAGGREIKTVNVPRGSHTYNIIVVGKKAKGDLVLTVLPAAAAPAAVASAKPPPSKTPPPAAAEPEPAADELQPPPKGVIALLHKRPLKYSLSDFKKTVKLEIEGPGTFTIDVVRDSKKPRVVKVMVVRGKKKKEGVLKVKKKPVSKQIRVPAGTQKYKIVALPKRKLPGTVTFTFEGEGVEELPPPMVATAPEPPTAPAAVPASSTMATTAAAGPAAGRAPEDKQVEVEGNLPVMALTTNPKRPFYQVNRANPLVVNAEGPGSLWFEIRRNLAPGAQGGKPLMVEGRLDNQVLWTFKARGMASEDKFNSERYIPGVREHVQLSVPPGVHKCELRLNSKNPNGISVAVDYGQAFGTPTMEVKRGAYLSGISQAAYGREELWTVIYEVNRELIGDDPNKVEVGLKLRIPSLGEAKQIQQWIESGRPDETTPELLRLAKKGSGAGKAGEGDGAVDLSKMGGPFRRYLDDAVKAQAKMYLHALVQSGAMEGAELLVEVDSPDFELARSQVRIDEMPLKPVPESAPEILGKRKILPGYHNLSVQLDLKGESGFFSYMSDQKFTVSGHQVVMVKAGKSYRARIVIRKTDEMMKNYKDRIKMVINVEPIDKAVSLAPKK